MSGWYTWNLKWIEMSYTSPCFHFIIQTTWLKCLFESFCHNVKSYKSYSLFTLTEFLSIWPNYLMLQWYSFIKKKKKKKDLQKWQNHQIWTKGIYYYNSNIRAQSFRHHRCINYTGNLILYGPNSAGQCYEGGMWATVFFRIINKWTITSISSSGKHVGTFLYCNC